MKIVGLDMDMSRRDIEGRERSYLKQSVQFQAHIVALSSCAIRIEMDRTPHSISLGMHIQIWDQLRGCVASQEGTSGSR
jgi:hypothetical protein